MTAGGHPLSVQQAAAARGPLLREFAPRADRVPADERVDAPEIQESYRVSFSSAVRAEAAAPVRDAAQRPTFTETQGAGADPRLALYRAVARL